MKKILLAASIAATLGLTACGSSDSSSSSEETTAATVGQTAAIETDEIATEAVEETAETTTDTETESDTESEAATETPIEFTPVEGLGETYVDLSNRSFAYEGKIYKLGEATLQDLIDGGLPFNENDLNNIDNNVNKNYETSRYDALINDYNSLQFTFINTTDGNLSEKECILSTVRWYTLYVPHDDYQESLNEEINDNLADCAKHLCFAFPLTLTKDQLLENSPEPTEQDDYGNVKYRVDSEVYMGSSGYNFQFDKDTDQLKDVSITWLP